MKFGDVINMYKGQIVVDIMLSLFISLSLLFIGYKFFQSLQSRGYKTKIYVKSVASITKINYLNLVFFASLSALAFIILNLSAIPLSHIIKGGSFANKNGYISLIGFIPYLFFFILFVVTNRREEKKTPLVYSARMKRLLVVTFVISFILTFGIILLSDAVAYKIDSAICFYLRYLFLTLLAIILPYIIALCSVIISPIEKSISKKYVKLAKNKIENSTCKVIGITGSAGKTTTKNFLYELLSQKYRVYKTPKSYNTPMGVCLAIKDINLDDYDFFLVEMGAKQSGDIKELCDLTFPTYSIITSVLPQHLETFKSFENVIKTKSEIIGGTKEFTLAINENDELIKYGEGKLVLVSLKDEKGYLNLKDIELTEKGSNLTFEFEEKEYKAQTKLLGNANAKNVLLSSAMALKLGLTVDEVISGIEKLESVDHRMKIVDSNNGTIVIDDAYNSNLQGFKGAIDTISLFKGRKILVTPGVIELGKTQLDENKKLGEYASGKVDIALFIGTNKTALKQGFILGGMAEENILDSDTLKEGMEKLKRIIKEGDVILFENDLPDTF